MLDTAFRNVLRGEFENVVDMLGVPGTWTQAKPPNNTLPTTVGFKTAGLDDKEVVNAYGVGAKIITFKAADFATTAPEKFDQLTIAGERYTLDEVMPIHLNGVLIFYKAFVRGK